MSQKALNVALLPKATEDEFISEPQFVSVVDGNSRLVTWEQLSSWVLNNTGAHFEIATEVNKEKVQRQQADNAIQLQLDETTATQSVINEKIPSDWKSRPSGYSDHSRVLLDNGDIVVNTLVGNTNNPNNNTTGWELGSTPSFKSILELKKYNPKMDKGVVYLQGLVVGSVAGAGYWFYDEDDTTSASNDWFILRTNSNKILKRVDINKFIDLDWAGITDGGDLAVRWQQASDYIMSQATEKLRTGGLPHISVSGQRYTMSKGVVLPTVVRTIAKGTVILDCTDWVDTTKGSKVIEIRNTTNLTYNRTGFAQQSAYLNGSVGGIHITGAGRTITGVTGVWVGNLAASLTPVRGSIMTNVSVTNFYKNVEWGRYNLYLQRYFQCQFEGGFYNLYSSNSAQTDSGERNSFVDCVFGAAPNHIYHNTPACDINFVDCSFDFSDDSCIYTGNQANFCTLRFTDCHFEDYANYLVDGVGVGYKSIVFKGCVFLKTGGLKRNSVSKPLFSPQLFTNGNASRIQVDGYEMRTTEQAWDRSVFVTGQLNNINNANITMKGCYRDAYGHVPSLRNILNKGYDFSGETVGADGTTVPFVNFSVQTKSGTSTLINNNKQLVLTKTAESNNITLVTPKIKVNGQSNFGVITSFIRNSSRNAKQANHIDYYDINDVLISSGSGFDVQLDSYWTNNLAPNFSEGDTRDIATQMQTLSTPPPNTASARLRVVVSQFTEALTVTSLMLIEFPI